MPIRYNAQMSVAEFTGRVNRLGRPTAAAEALGISYNTLRRYLLGTLAVPLPVAKLLLCLTRQEGVRVDARPTP